MRLGPLRVEAHPGGSPPLQQKVLGALAAGAEQLHSTETRECLAPLTSLPSVMRAVRIDPAKVLAVE